MSELELSSARPTTTSAHALRLVLFGMPHAGKSSLLGALLQAAQNQEHALNGRLIDLSHGLAELQRRLYEEQPHGTPEEIIPYPVLFEPFADKGTHSTGKRFEAVLVDCSGMVANDLLTRRRTLDGTTADGSLGQSILAADTLFLVVDASAADTQMEADFGQFARFLSLFEKSRGRRTDVSGMPVFLVLTKCDLLARPGDTAASWIEQIEERKRRTAEHFRNFLAQSDAARATPFGRIDMHLWATAVKRPALADTPERPRDPYGVAELFRQGFSVAKAFRKHQRRSSRRLLVTVSGTLLALAVLLLAGVFLFLSRRGSPGRLETRVDRYRSQQQTQTPLAAYRNPKQQIDELTTFTKESAFQQLPEEKQEYVRERLQELKAYQDYEEKLRAVTNPADATSLAQLDETENFLKQMTLPADYQGEWSQTEAGRRQADWLEDVEALRKAADSVQRWYQKLIRDGQEVLDNINGPNLPARARKVLQEAKSAPFPENDKDRALPGSRRVTYAAVFGLSDIAEKRRKWEEDIRKKLEPYAKFDQP